MKFSMFNVFTQIDDDCYILTNTMSGGMYRIDSNTRDRILNDDFKNFSEKEIESYLTNGIILEDDVNEIQRYNYFSNKYKYIYIYMIL